MSSSSLEAERPGALGRLLDPVFGFFVWVVHLAVLYSVESVACVLGIGARPTSLRTAFLLGLGVLTALAALVVVGHALRRRRPRPGLSDDPFMRTVAIGADALATLAIVLQLLPIYLVPLCR
jgi:hypothetical protein